MESIVKIEMIDFLDSLLPYVWNVVPFFPLVVCCCLALFYAYKEACFAKDMWENVIQTALRVAVFHIFILPVVLIGTAILWNEQIAQAPTLIYKNFLFVSVLNILMSLTVLLIPFLLCAYCGHYFGKENFSRRWEVMSETEAGRHAYRQQMKQQKEQELEDKSS